MKQFIYLYSLSVPSLQVIILRQTHELYVKEKVSTYSKDTKYTEVPLHTWYVYNKKWNTLYCKVIVHTKVKIGEVKQMTGWGK